MDRLKEMILKIMKNHDWYLADPSIMSLFHFLQGFVEYAVRQNTTKSLTEEMYYFNDLSHWVARYYDVKKEKGWWSVILFHSTGERDAFENFCRLYNLYLKDGEWHKQTRAGFEKQRDIYL